MCTDRSPSDPPAGSSPVPGSQEDLRLNAEHVHCQPRAPGTRWPWHIDPIPEHEQAEAQARRDLLMLECYVSVLSQRPEGGQDGTERKRRHEGVTFLPDGPHSPKWVMNSPTSTCLEKRYREASAWCACVFKMRHLGSTESIKTFKIHTILQENFLFSR